MALGPEEKRVVSAWNGDRSRPAGSCTLPETSTPRNCAQSFVPRSENRVRLLLRELNTSGWSCPTLALCARMSSCTGQQTLGRCISAPRHAGRTCALREQGGLGKLNGGKANE